MRNLSTDCSVMEEEAVNEEIPSIEDRTESISDDEEESSGDDSEGYNAFDEPTIDETEAEVHEYLRTDVREATSVWYKCEEEIGIPSVQIEPSIHGRPSSCSVVMTLNVSKLPEMIRHLWELGTAMTVAVIVDGVDKREFRAAEIRPTVFARIDSDKPSKFPVGECLCNIIKSIIADTYSLPTNMSPAETGSYFCLLYEQLVERVRTLTEFCMVCGAKMYVSGLLPSICDGELCQYQYQELGLMDGLTTPRVSAPVLSLLMTLFSAAVKSDRCDDILMPAPSTHNLDKLIVDVMIMYAKFDKDAPQNAYASVYAQKFRSSSSAATMDDGGKDIYKLVACVMPCAHDILKTPFHYEEFKKATPRMAHFVEWLVISVHSYLELVPSKLKVDFLQNKAQFLYVADTPAKQTEFDALKNANGGKTRYFFHGSRAENWHSIIHSGLRCMSGTKYMLMGNSHGDGIYMTPHLTTSFQYCSVLFDNKNISEQCMDRGCCFASMNYQGFGLLALVEVVDTPDAFRYSEDAFVVVKEEKWATIRMVVGYDWNTVPDINLMTIEEKDRRQINDVVNMFKTADLAERAKHTTEATELFKFK